MPKRSRWSKDDRAQLLKMVRNGEAEQTIREHFSFTDAKGVRQAMSAMTFAQQLKQGMVEAGEIKQALPKSKHSGPSIYTVSATGRLTIHDFHERTGADVDEKFTLEPPRGRSPYWRIVPFKQ